MNSRLLRSCGLSVRGSPGSLGPAQCETWLLLEEILLPVEPCEAVLVWDLRDSPVCHNFPVGGSGTPRLFSLDLLEVEVEVGSTVMAALELSTSSVGDLASWL